MKPFQLLRTRAPSTFFSASQHTLRQSERAATTCLSNLSRPHNLLRDSRLFSYADRHPRLLLQRQRSRNLHNIRRPYSTRPPTHNAADQPADQLTASQRFRKLGREYGWSVMAVYLGLSALDFPLCFAAVQWLGVERVGHAERVVVEGVREYIPEPVKDAWKQLKAGRKELMGQKVEEAHAAGSQAKLPVAGVVDDYDHGLKEAEKVNQSENASIWTQMAVAYAIHKSFIFIRLPLTVAVTPKVVKVLRGWGWDIGKRRPKIVKEPKR